MRLLFSFRLVLAALISLTLASTPAEAGWLFKRSPTMRGRIANVVATPNTDAAVKGLLGTVLVVGEGERDPRRQQVWVSITDDTKIEGIQLSQKSFAILAAGMSVEVKFDGKLPATFPVTGMAKAIRILDRSHVRR